LLRRKLLAAVGLPPMAQQSALALIILNVPRPLEKQQVELFLRLFISIPGMNDYSRMSREELIERLRALEEKVDPGNSSGLTSRERQAESALRESEERMRAILHTAVEGIITIDQNGIIERINPAAETLFGYSPGELIGQSVNVLMPSPYREEHDNYLRNYLRTGHAKIIGIGREVVGKRKDGSLFPMDLSVGEVKLEQERLFTGIVRNITARKEAEARLADLAQSLAEKNKELETILYVASHDLRSPLVNIQGFSRELAQACKRVQEKLSSGQGEQLDAAGIHAILEEDVKEAIDYIQAGVAKMDTLLSGFLRFSRLGRAALNIQTVSMNLVVKQVIQSMEFQIKQAGATVRAGDLPNCKADPAQLNQVFSNLLENALKYLDPSRPGVISISGRLEKERAIYSVHDNGIGIARQHQEKIFEIFHRLNPAATQGEGLGLTIAQRILERQNGRIWLESEPGRGSDFLVSLPALPMHNT
jgi:two-component system, chemotaxis family, sensor kinase Cph1